MAPANTPDATDPHDAVPSAHAHEAAANDIGEATARAGASAGREPISRRTRHPDGDPSAITWLIAVVGMGLPWLAAGLGIAGGWRLSRGESAGWSLLGAGAAALSADLLIDFAFARRAVASDPPDLNRRGAQLVGRLLVVAEAIEGGRGKVRAGDTLWPAEGPDTPAGGKVAVTGTNGTALVVERARS